MVYMIRNLFVIKNSLLLVSENLGACHSLSQNEDLVSSFLTAINSISNLISGSSLKNIDLGDFTLYFHEEPKDSKILLVAIADINDKEKDVNDKLRKIATFFLDKYNHNLVNFNGERSQFQDFKRFLIANKLVEKTCRKKANCEDCSNRFTNDATVKQYENKVRSTLQTLSKKLKN